MAKANIETKNGTKILVEGTSKEINEVISSIQRREQLIERKRVLRKSRPETATSTIIELKDSGFFNKPKTIADIKVALAEKGMIYPSSSLSPILLRLVKKRRLSRIKKNKIWCYVKR